LLVRNIRFIYLLSWTDQFPISDVSLEGVGLPRANETVFFRTTFSTGTATPSNLCNQPALSDSGNSLGCRFNIQDFGATNGLIVANMTLLRQNVPQLSHWTVIRFFNTLPQLSQPKDAGSLPIAGIISYTEAAAPSFDISIVSTTDGVSARGETAVRKDLSTCPQYFVTCAEQAFIKTFTCTITLNSAWSVYDDCRVILTPYKWDVAGPSNSIVVVAERPYIALVRPEPIFLSQSHPFATFEVVGSFFNSSNPLVNDPPTVKLSSTSGSYFCQVVSFSFESIICNITIPATASGTDFDITVTRYSVSGFAPTALVVKWLPNIDTPVNLTRLDPFAASTVSITGVRLCPISNANITAQIEAHPMLTSKFPKCDAIGRSMDATPITVSGNSMTFTVTPSNVNNPNCALSVAVSCYGDPHSDPVVVAALVQTPLTFVPLDAMAAVGAGQSISSLTIDFFGIDFDPSYAGSFQLDLAGTAAAPSCRPQVASLSGRESSMSCVLGPFIAPTALGSAITLKVGGAQLTWGVVASAPSLGPASELFTEFDPLGQTRLNASVSLTLYNMNTDVGLINSIGFAASVTSGGDPSLVNCPGLIPKVPFQVNARVGESTGAIANFTLTFDFPSAATWDGCTLKLEASLFEGFARSSYSAVTKFVARPYVNETWGVTGQIAALNGDGTSIDLFLDNVLTAFATPVSGQSFAPALILSSNCSVALPAATSFGVRQITPYVFMVNATASNIISLAALRSDGTIDGCDIYAKLQRTAQIISVTRVFIGHIALKPVGVAVVPNDRVFTNIISSVAITGEFVSTPNAADFTLALAVRPDCNALPDPTTYMRRRSDGAAASLYFNIRQATPVKCNADVALVKFGVPVWLYLLTLPVAPTLNNPTPGTISGRVLGTHPPITQADQVATAFRVAFGLNSSELSVSLSAKKRDTLDHETIVMTFAGSNGRNTFDNIAASADSQSFFSEAMTGVLTTQAAGTARSFGSVTYSLSTPPSATDTIPFNAAVVDNNNLALSISLGVVFAVLGIVAIAAIVFIILRRRKGKKDTPDKSTEMADTPSGAKATSQYGSLKSDSTKPANAYGSISGSAPPASRKGVLQVDQVEDSGSEVDTDHLDNLSKMMQSEFDSKWYIPFEDIKFLKVLGRGAYGQVHKAKWNGGLVAVKQTMALQIDQTGVEEFKHEAKLLLNLQPHPNVVQIRLRFHREFPPHY
jgi:hypothetical protein